MNTFCSFRQLSQKEVQRLPQDGGTPAGIWASDEGLKVMDQSQHAQVDE